MRTLQRIGAAAASVALVAGAGIAAAAPASAATVSGTTAVTTAPGVATALIGRGIVPYALSPASTTPLFNWKTGLQVRYGFPVTGVTVDAGGSTLGAVNIQHSGGLALASLQNFNRVTLRNFTIDISEGVIKANVGGVPGVSSAAQIPVFSVVLPAGVDPNAPIGSVTVSGVQVNLAPGIAGVLNSVLVKPGAKPVFAEGQNLGSATVAVTVS